MTALRRLLNISTLCVALGVAGGLLFGVVLSRTDGWLTPAPWVFYALLLLLAVCAVSFFDARHVEAVRAEEAWPLAPGYGSDLVGLSVSAVGPVSAAEPAAAVPAAPGRDQMAEHGAEAAEPAIAPDPAPDEEAQVAAAPRALESLASPADPAIEVEREVEEVDGGG